MQQSGSVLALLGSSHAKVSHTPRTDCSRSVGVSTQPTRPPALANLSPYQEHPPTVGRPGSSSPPAKQRTHSRVLRTFGCCGFKLRRSAPKQMDRQFARTAGTCKLRPSTWRRFEYMICIFFLFTRKLWSTWS